MEIFSFLRLFLFSFLRIYGIIGTDKNIHLKEDAP